MPKDDKLLVGAETSDDAGVYLLNDEQAIIQTLDFFTPMVDNPYDFGMIAASNALSDVYAMGGRPLLCMNILACPLGDMDEQVFRDVVAGGLAKVEEAGALLVGGHSIEDKELKYGLSVTGLVHPDKVLLNSGAREGDVLLLTKPLGSGVLSTAIKGSLASDELIKEMVTIMATLNKEPARLIEELSLRVHACTDITGFGLFGHGHEMAIASGCTISFFKDKIPYMQEAVSFADMGMIPQGAYANNCFYSKWCVNLTPEPDSKEMLCFDPQTSGGLLLSMPEEDGEKLLQLLLDSEYLPGCAIIGHVKKGKAGMIEIIG